MKRTRAALALVPAALLLPGCFFANRAFPTDTSGMDYPLSHFASRTADQVERTRAFPETISDALDRHFRECERAWRYDPSDLPE